MMTATIRQTGLFGKSFTVAPDCSECEDTALIKAYEDLNGNTLCPDCFEDAGLTHCPNCGDVVDCDDLAKNPDGDDCCEDCATADSFTCDNCDERTWDNDCVQVEGRRTWRGITESQSLCESCADDITFCCDDCGDRYHQDDSVRVPNGNDICQSCYEDGYITCESCSDIVHQDDSYCTDDGCYCSGCRSDGENFDPAGFRNHGGCVTETGSARCFGIELETDECDGYNALEDTGAWGAKDDCTVSGKEFFSDILNGDEGLDAVREWGKLADNNCWEAGRSAGYHLHIDMRREDDDSLYAIAYAYRKTQEVWLSFVDGRRHTGGYSHSIQWDCTDLVRLESEGRAFSSFACRGTRYNWLNVTAFSCHGTFENRLHEGTCNDTEVINWVKANTRFADWASDLGFEGVREALDGLTYDDMFRLFMRDVWRDYKLSEYYANKARRHNHGFLRSCINLEPCTT